MGLAGAALPAPVNNSRKAGFMGPRWLWREPGRRGNVLEKSISGRGNGRQLGLQDPSHLPAASVQAAPFPVLLEGERLSWEAAGVVLVSVLTERETGTERVRASNTPGLGLACGD